MFELFTDAARHIVVQAQKEARRLGHNYIGCEHLLMAAAGAAEPASAVLRDQGVTPERVEALILRTAGPGPAADPLGGLDGQALAFLGIDLDVVRARVEAAFGPDALTRALPAACRRRRPAWGKGPLAELTRRQRRVAPVVTARCPRARSGRVPPRPGLLPVAISRSRHGPRRACRSRCARPRRCTTTTSAPSTSSWPCSPRKTARYRRSCWPWGHRPRRCAPPSSPATARPADPGPLSGCWRADRVTKPGFHDTLWG